MDNKTNKFPFQKKKAKACQAAIIDKESSDEGTDHGSPEANCDELTDYSQQQVTGVHKESSEDDRSQ